MLRRAVVVLLTVDPWILLWFLLEVAIGELSVAAIAIVQWRPVVLLCRTIVQLFPVGHVRRVSAPKF